MDPRPRPSRGVEHGNRTMKAAEQLTQHAATYIAMEAGRESLITPTRTDLSPDRKNATIYVSVFPDTADRIAVEFLMRHKDLFRKYLKETARLGVLPYIKFELDYGERNRQRLDELSRDA